MVPKGDLGEGGGGDAVYTSDKVLDVNFEITHASIISKAK